MTSASSTPDAASSAAGASADSPSASATGRATANPALSQRIAAIDWMRGFVMILMAIDHASQTWNAGRVSADSAYLPSYAGTGPMWVPGTELDAAQFFTRWITHLCAPTFLFLSGTSLAMSFEKRRSEGMDERELDRHLLVRALVVLGFEALLSLMAGLGIVMLQVLFAIGTSMIAMVVLRRLPTGLLLAIGLGWLVGSEAVLMQLFPIPETFSPGEPLFSLGAMLFFVPGFGDGVVVFYPMTHWLAMMLIGWAFGRYLLEQPATDYGRQQAEKLLLLSGLSALLFWAFLRSGNAYGNMGLYRDDATIVQWLHMSKYPPALVYSLMELGLMALLLVVFMRFERRMRSAPNRWNPLLVFGQTALFFYILHFVLLGGSAVAITGGMMLRGLPETYTAAGAVLVLLYPICLGFRALEAPLPEELPSIHLASPGQPRSEIGSARKLRVAPRKRQAKAAAEHEGPERAGWHDRQQRSPAPRYPFFASSSCFRAIQPLIILSKNAGL